MRDNKRDRLQDETAAAEAVPADVQPAPSADQHAERSSNVLADSAAAAAPPSGDGSWLPSPPPQQSLASTAASAADGSRPVEAWTVGDVLGWLEAVGLGEHRQEFERHRVDGCLLPELDSQDLKRELGVRSRLERKRVLKRITLLLQQQEQQH